jgi:hypothetical protein
MSKLCCYCYFVDAFTNDGSSLSRCFFVSSAKLALLYFIAFRQTLTKHHPARRSLCGLYTRRRAFTVQKIDALAQLCTESSVVLERVTSKSTVVKVE